MNNTGRPSRKPLTAVRLREIADQATTAAIEKYGGGFGGNVKLSCTYVGNHDPEHVKALVQFKWVNDDREELVVVRCDKALYMNYIPFPRHWRLPLLIVEITGRIRAQNGLQWMKEFGDGNVVLNKIVACKRQHAPPKTEILYVRGERIEHILCANISDDVWLCHPGTLTLNGIDTTWPFHPVHLRSVDIKSSRGVGHDRPKKRLRGRVQYRELLSHAEKYFLDVDLICGLAIWLAEECRAVNDRRSVDRNVAESALEADPYNWHAVEKVLLIWSHGQGQRRVWRATPILLTELLKDVMLV